MKHFYPNLFRLVGVLLVWMGATTAHVHAQSPTWQTAVAFRPDPNTPGSGNVSVGATATDAAGNIYLCGPFNGTAVFGTFSLASSRSYGYDVFVAKWNPRTGSFAWAVRAGGGGTVSVTSLSVQGTSVYIGGSFFQSATFGATTLTCASNNNDVYVAKLTDTGASTAFTWAVRTQTTGSLFDTRDAYITASNNGIYLATNFVGAATFGGRTLVSAGFNDVLVAKLTDAGSTASFTWAQRAGGSSIDFVYAVAVAGDRVYVAGSTSSGTADFGNTTLTSGSGNAGFVAKLTDAGPTGSFAWAQLAGQYNYALAANGPNIYLAGTFVGSSTLGTLPVNSSGSSVASYVAKLTDAGPSGSFAWAQVIGGPNNCFLNRLAVNGPNVYATGSFYQAVQVGTTAFTSYGRYDGLLVKLLDAGPTGSIAWAQQAGGPSDDGLGDILLSNGSVYVAGGMNGDMQFGSLVLPAVGGSANGFLASVADATVLAIASPVKQRTFQFFPNPAHGSTSVQLPAGTVAADAVLCDALGRPVRCRILPTADGTVELDLAGLAPGLYCLRSTTCPTFGSRLLVN